MRSTNLTCVRSGTYMCVAISTEKGRGCRLVCADRNENREVRDHDSALDTVLHASEEANGTRPLRDYGNNERLRQGSMKRSVLQAYKKVKSPTPSNCWRLARCGTRRCVTTIIGTL